MNVNCTKLLMAVVAYLCGAAAQAATLSWESHEVTASSMAFTPSHLLVLNDGEILPLDIATGRPAAAITATNIRQIGNSGDGTAWACRYDTSSPSGPQIVLSTIASDGAMGHEHAISTSQLDPAAYNGVREHTFGPVTVAG
ncbi:MAG: hypothetical protein K2L93_07180, partial [Muribaculaceae bacterium]|nr:hypothetical protein [Muribaculaceae bacterium]